MNSNGNAENITINTCQYTPVLLIQNNSITQAKSYVIAPPVQEESKPVSNNLKLFYENSGNIENSILLNNVQYVQNTVTTKPDNGKSLEVASFLVPKKDGNKQQYIATVSNKILKPSITSGNANVLPNVNIITPKVNGSRKKTITRVHRTMIKPRILPKIKPKEESPEPSKQTSVHLLKLGGAYHSLNQLNDEQMRLVNKALEKIQGDPEKATLKPTYDPVTNTQIVYKVVSPNDLKIVGKNKILIKANSLKKSEPPKDEVKVKEEEKVESNNNEDASSSDEANEVLQEVKVTRSGRTVKLPKHIIQTQEDPPPKAKKKINPITCLQCNAELGTMYRLQRHYEKYPAHIPTNVHTNLFHCLLSMVQDGAEEDKTTIFIKQLEQLIEKIKKLLPCLLKKVDGNGGTLCNINEDIGRLFGMNPGKYNLNMDALSCVKDNEGHCKHDPPKVAKFTAYVSKPSQIWLTKHQEENTVDDDSERDGCARIIATDKWAVKRQYKHKNKEKTVKNKKVKLVNDPAEPLIELGNEIIDTIDNIEGIDNINGIDTMNAIDAINDIDSVTTIDNIERVQFLDTDSVKNDATLLKEANILPTDNNTKSSHSHFYSTHFDIRSSPMKPSATIFNKFQIDPDKMPNKFEAQLLKPLSFDTEPSTDIGDSEKDSDNSIDLNGIIKELNNHSNNLVSEITGNDVCKDNDLLDRLTFPDPKEWNVNISDDQGIVNDMKPNSSLVPAMVYVQDNLSNGTNYDNNYNNFSVSDNVNSINSDMGTDKTLNQSTSVLQFLDSLNSDLTCPVDSELRNNSIDFSLDLFSFNPE